MTRATRSFRPMPARCRRTAAGEVSSTELSETALRTEAEATQATINAFRVLRSSEPGEEAAEDGPPA